MNDSAPQAPAQEPRTAQGSPTEQESPTEQDSGHGFSWYAWLALVVLVAYPLSIGPAARLHNAYPSSRKAIEAIYMPVTLLIHHSPAAEKCVEWYIVRVWKAH